MKKKKLKEFPELLVTPAIRDAEKKDKPKKYIRYGNPEEAVEYPRFYRAAVHGDILQVALFTHDSIRCGNRPLYTIFIDKEQDEHVTLTQEGKWRKGKIDSLEVDGRTWGMTQKEWSSRGDRKLVNDFFDTEENKNVYQAVLQWQSDLGVRALKKRWASEIEQIDAVMSEVPDEPKDLRTWISSHAFDESIFYMKNKKRVIGYCTHCKSWVDLKTVNHGEEGKCPRCRAAVTWRSWRKQKTVEDEQWVGVLQRLQDESGYILRGYRCRIKWRLENDWENPELNIWEGYRTRLGKTFNEAEQYEWAEWKNTETNRWCHPVSHGYYGVYERFGRALMYTANMRKELKNEQFARVNVAKIMDYGRSYKEPAYILRRLYKYPYIEYMQKAGLHRLVKEIMKAQEYSSCFDPEKKKINEVLKLDKQRYNKLKEWNGGSNTLYLLQLEQNFGGRITKEISEWVEKEKGVMGLETLCRRTGLNVVQQLNYIKKQMELMHMNLHDTENTYADYLNMAEDRGMDIKDDIVCRQKNMREYHDRYAEEKNAENNRKRDKEVNRKFAQIAQQYAQNTEHFALEDKNLMVVVPRRASDITAEGRKQHHCVGASDIYMKKMNEGKTYIVFLRDKKNPKTPYYTIEVGWDGDIKQWYAAYDRKPDEEKIKKVLECWKKQIKARCKKEQVQIRAAV